jgi:hypothetical protein
VTRQYLIGELSARLEQLQAVAPPAAARDVADLRCQVETRPASWLPAGLAQALALTDRACWDALESGDATTFARLSAIGSSLRLFGLCARLIDDH